MKLRIASRKSPLALRQTAIVANQLKNQWPTLEIEVIAMSTKGDELLDKTLLNFGGKGLFVKELEQALLDNKADIAVHSMKDVPAKLPNQLELGVICRRDNPYDVLIQAQSISLLDLPKGASIGTASLRRQAQLKACRPDIHTKVLRGNIQTRLAKLDSGEFDAIVLAKAGLDRMALEMKITEVFHKDIMLPACGQGAIGIECRRNDQAILDLITPLHHEKTAICVHLERQVNQALGGHCHVPIAIFAEFITDERIELEAKVFSHNGDQCLAWKAQFHQLHAFAQAKQCAADLLAQGALELIQSCPS
ncbi:MAG: hydroxymethylbilane synthase [Gammaproteobacteria bacterium]|nr:hydroxymethylbilane synthase [Gammaproteobacteria bacterium]